VHGVHMVLSHFRSSNIHHIAVLVVGYQTVWNCGPIGTVMVQSFL